MLLSENRYCVMTERERFMCDVVSHLTNTIDSEDGDLRWNKRLSVSQADNNCVARVVWLNIPKQEKHWQFHKFTHVEKWYFQLFPFIAAVFHTTAHSAG